LSPTKPTKPVDIYVRVSRVAGRGGESFQSPEQQEQKCRAQLKADDLEAGDVFVDLDQSGAKASHPEFDKCLARIESGESGGVIVYDLSRFGRNVRNVLDGIEQIEARRAVFISCVEKFDTSTSNGIFVLTMFAALRELERSQSKERWRDSQANAIGRGVHIASRPAVGYVRTGDGRLHPDPVATPVVREVFAKRAAGASWLELTRFLDEKLPKPNGGAWHPPAVVRMIQRRTYLGEAWAGDLINPDAHEPILSLAEWEAAQRPRKLQTPRQKDPSLLGGLVYCAGCGHPMTRGTGAKVDGGYKYRYTCRKRHEDGLCPAPSVIETTITDEYVEQKFLARVTARPVVSTPVEGIEDLVTAYEDALNELAAFQKHARATDPGYADALEYRRAQVETARRELAERQQADSTGLMRTDLVEFWPEMTIAERRQILAAAIENVSVRKAARRGRNATSAEERLTITWR
jgi:DNA invertase Pin-like site-specific DNA recombinase